MDSGGTGQASVLWGLGGGVVWMITVMYAVMGEGKFRFLVWGYYEGDGAR